jgi:predicted RNA-binding Zn-ribbon protein involved in translation (DUF1610 family)
MPAPVEAGPQQAVVDFTCPQCGATTAYTVSGGGLTCTHCGYVETPQKPTIGRGAESFEFKVETLDEAASRDAGELSAQGWGEARTEMACQSCGAVNTIGTASLTYTCPFCGSNKVLQRQAPQDILRPRFLIPFKIDTPVCDKIARDWLGKSWMVPGDLRNSSKLGSFSPVYLPYWTFDADTSASWKAEVGHQKTERYYEDGKWKERTVTVWRWESGNVSLRIDDHLEPGTAKLSRVLMQQVHNFDLDGLCPYEPKYLAGYQAQAYDVPLEAAWARGREDMREQTHQACLGQASTSQVRNFRMELDFANESWRYILLPVYVTAYTYAGKTYQAMINGQQGTIAGQRPVDWNKIWLVIALALAPGAIIGLLGLITMPLLGIGVGIGLFGFVLLMVGVIISVAIYAQANKMDDV